MERSKAFSLKHSQKAPYFDCHRMFVPQFHRYQRSHDGFLKGQIKKCIPPLHHKWDEVWSKV